MIKKFLKKISLFISSILILGTVTPSAVLAYENISNNEIIEITEDTDYSKLNRTPWKDINWSKYGGSGVENPELQNYLANHGINPIEDEDYGLKQEEVTKKVLSEQKADFSTQARSSVNDWYVGQVISGLCDITRTWYVTSEGQSYFELGNFRNGLESLEQVGNGWCANHTAAEPAPGHPITEVTATVTSIDRTNGWVYFNVLVVPQGVTDGSSNGNGLTGYQRVASQARMKVNVEGNLQILKKSADPSITDGNNCYSLGGAQYTIYSDPNAVHAITTVTLDTNGWSAPVALSASTYYVMETKAPKGYALDNKVYPVTVTAGQTTSKTFTDRPQTDPISIILRKIDSLTGEGKPQGGASLADAHFTVKFYAGEYDDGLNPADIGVSPTKTWLLKTDDRGRCRLNDDYKVSGDEFWYNSFGIPTLPLGTITSQETKAPVGYKLNPEIFVRKITPNGTAEGVNTYNAPIVSEEVIKGQVKVIKVDEETGERLQGAEFELKDRVSGQVVETLVTGEDGSATSGLHPFGEYILRETKAPHKYTLNGQEHFVTINQDLQTIELTHENRIIKGRVEINKEDSEIAGLKLEGVRFGIFNENKKLVEELITDENGYAISGWLNYGDYILRELATKDGYRLNGQEWKIKIREDKKTYTYNITNDVIKGKIQVVKIDSQNAEKPVNGATFNVVAENVFGVAAETVVDTITTDENGFAFTKNLRYGDYYLIETNVGDDYWLNATKYPVSIKEHGKVVVKHIKNEPVQMRLRVLKSDAEDNQPLSDVKFKVVQRANGEEVEFIDFIGIIPVKRTVFTTNKEGEILFPQRLNYGKYQLVEVEGREGYNPIAPIDFEITRDTDFEEIELLGKVHTIEVENTRVKGNLKLVKVDKETRTPLSDVKFKITCTYGFNKGQEWIEITDENGEINLNDLQHGKYVAEEIEPLWNYAPNNKKYKFEITEHGKTIELKVENEKIKGRVELLKVDEDTNRPLEGVEFELWNGERLVGTYATNKDGKIVVENLEAGNYYFREVKALDEYISNNEMSYDFVITKQGELIKITATNKVKEGEVDFSKTDVSTGELIEGATIEINGLEEHNKHINIEFVSTKEETRFKLPIGKYEFKETIAPEGYVLNEEVGYFEIKENEVVKAELKNKRINGTLDFSKTDVSTGEVIDGAHIKIECVEGFNKGQVIEFISSSEGNRFELEYGKYKFYETMAPEGYELSTEVGEFEITEDGKVVKAELKNKRIPKLLPQTGGKAGSLIVIPGLIILVLGVLLFTKKRTNK